MNEVSADKAYSSAKNLKLVVSKAAMPYIAFRANATGSEKYGGSVWKSMYQILLPQSGEIHAAVSQTQQRRIDIQHDQSEFGDSLRSKTKTAQVNEALCKVLCHTLCCVIQSMYELNITPEFWAEAA